MATARSRKWLITINNPTEHGFDHARIKAAVLDLPGVLYWCMCDEQGDECETLHTHVYVVCREAVSHTQIDARFPSFHRDILLLACVGIPLCGLGVGLFKRLLSARA